jgi:hypothetical protein
MRSTSKLAVLLAALAGTASVHAATLVPVPIVPGSTNTYVTDINDKNVIVGEYEMPDGSFHGFYGPLGGQYTTFDFDETNYPGTDARGIDNKGDIVGSANEDNEPPIYDVVQFERFANGSMKLIKNHGTPTAGLTGGINSKGVFVVENWHSDNTVDGFTGKKAKAKEQIDLGFTTVRVRPRDINVSGDVAGYTKVTASTGYQGFVLHDGTTTLVNYPDETATNTLLEGINSKGISTGFWGDADFNEFGFIYDTKTAKFSPITIPGFPQSSAGGVNAAGLIVAEGYSQDFTQAAPYIYCPKKPSKCPSGGFEIADPKPVAMVAGYKPHSVSNPAALTPARAKLQMRQ